MVNRREGWADRVTMVDRSRLSAARATARLVAGGAQGRGLVLQGSAGFDARYVDLLAAMAVARLRRPPPLVLSECTWEPGSAALARRLPLVGGRGTARLAVRAMDGDHVTFCVLSSAERERFPSTWGVDSARVAFTPFTITLTDEELSAPPPPAGATVFAGGNSLRDYDALLAAAPGIPAPLVVATSRLEGRSGVPANVRAGPMSHRDYQREMRAARVVVVPLEDNRWRSSGQQTYLNAMALGKPVVVTDVMGVRDYVEHRETAVVVPPADPQAMGEAVRYLLDPDNAGAVRGMAERARAIARARFGIDRYLVMLRSLVGDTAARCGRR